MRALRVGFLGFLDGTEMIAKDKMHCKGGFSEFSTVKFWTQQKHKKFSPEWTVNVLFSSIFTALLGSFFLISSYTISLLGHIISLVGHSISLLGHMLLILSHTFSLLGHIISLVGHTIIS